MKADNDPMFGSEPPRRPWYRKKRWWGAGLLALAFVIAIAAAAGGEDDGDGGDTATAEEPGPQTASGNTENPPPDDVELTTCANDPALGLAKVGGTITNHSSKPSDYTISVEFVTGNDVRYAEAIHLSTTVAPDQTVEWEEFGTGEWREGTTCRVTSVERFAS